MATPDSKEVITILTEKAKKYKGNADKISIEYDHRGVGDLRLYFKNGFAAPQTFTGTLYYSYVKAYPGAQPDKDWAKKQTEIY